MVGERNLRYYPCSLALAGSNGSKSNNLVRHTHLNTLHLQIDVTIVDQLAMGCHLRVENSAVQCRKVQKSSKL